MGPEDVAMRTRGASRGAVRIRDAQPEDAADVARLLGLLGYPCAAEEAAARLARLSTDAARVLVAVADGGIAGVAAVHRLDSLHHGRPLAWVSALVVDVGARGGGVGRALVEASIRQARSWGCARLELTSGDHRVAAHAFYGRLGFASTGRKFVYDLGRRARDRQ